MADAISNFDDVIDSRDVIARIEELTEERDAFRYVVNDEDAAAEDKAKAAADLEEWEDDNGDELKALTTLAKEAEGYAPDWRHGESLIRDSYFKTYAQELAEDTGAIKADATWPNNCINWDQAARELQMDYTAVDFAGVTYWIR